MFLTSLDFSLKVDTSLPLLKKDILGKSFIPSQAVVALSQLMCAVTIPLLKTSFATLCHFYSKMLHLLQAL